MTKLAVYADYPKMEDFAEELVVLDCSRMLLWSPDESSDVDELENDEYQACSRNLKSKDIVCLLWSQGSEVQGQKV
jgi:hypothetical protein